MVFGLGFMNPVSERGSTRESGGERTRACVHMLVCVLHDQNAMVTSVRLSLGFRASRLTRRHQNATKQRLTNQVYKCLCFLTSQIFIVMAEAAGLLVSANTRSVASAQISVAPFAVALTRAQALSQARSHVPSHTCP
jgi:hypothetical protein